MWKLDFRRPSSAAGWRAAHRGRLQTKARLQIKPSSHVCDMATAAAPSTSSSMDDLSASLLAEALGKPLPPTPASGDKQAVEPSAAAGAVRSGRSPSKDKAAASKSSSSTRSKKRSKRPAPPLPPISLDAEVTGSGSSSTSPDQPPRYVSLGSPARIRREASNVARAVVSAFVEAGARAIARRPGGDQRVISEAMEAGKHTKTMHDALKPDTRAQEEAALAAASKP